MPAQYLRSNNPVEPMSSQHHNSSKGSKRSTSRSRAPLGQRSLNTQHQPASSKGRSVPVKSKSSSQLRPSKSRDNNEPIEFEEHRRKPNGEGHTVHRYLRGKMLGKGGFAKVYHCTSLDTNRSYAVKVVQKANLVKSRARQKLQAEIKIHRLLKHKHVCEYKHFFEDKSNCYILLELCQNQSMNELLKRRKRLTEPEVKYYLSQILLSVQYMHKLNVIHRDLKLGNLFLDKQLRVKVGDFGLATKLSASDEKRKTICGTPNYIAPEVIEGDKEKRGHSFEVDVWSMGVICYTLLVGKPPYESKDVKSTYQRILRNEYSFPSHIPISEHARHLISSMLQTRPDQRPSLETIIDHPFFTHDPTKIPKSLPPCCTHVAPDWQEDHNGYLVPILAEVEEQQSYPSKLSNTRNQKQPLGAVQNVQIPTRATKPAPKPASQFQIFSESSQQRPTITRSDSQRSVLPQSRSSQHDLRQSDDIELCEKLNACEIEDSPVGQEADGPSQMRNGSDADAAVLESMYSRLKDLGTMAEASAGTKNEPAVQINAGGAKKWVTRYVDYTSKYGLGFLFSDGSAGVYFNDSTKAVVAPKGENFIYVERKKSSDTNGGRIEQVPETHTLSKHPETLQKKVTLLKHFRNYLIEQHKRDDSIEEDLRVLNQFNNDEEDVSTPTIFLKKWVRTKHAILFRLSNQTVQVVFYDHTEIVLTTDARVVTYVNKKQERETYHLSDVMMSTEHGDVKKRLKYAEGILQQLVSSQKK